MAIVSPVYPGTPLQVGSYGSPVARVQTYLNALNTQYPSLPKLVVDGKFGNNTKTAVQIYQAVKGLQVDGIVGQNTWNTLIGEYNDRFGGSADTYPGIPLKNGMTGEDVTHMQTYLNALAKVYTAINTLTVDGNFGTNTQNAVQRFQKQFGLTADGEIGQNTWNKIVSAYNAVQTGNPLPVVTPYPGTPVQQGSSGDSVRFVQSYLNAADGAGLVIDGQFGSKTKTAVVAFQAQNGLKPDGIVGSATWAALRTAFNATL